MNNESVFSEALDDLKKIENHRIDEDYVKIEGTGTSISMEN